MPFSPQTESATRQASEREENEKRPGEGQNHVDEEEATRALAKDRVGMKARLPDKWRDDKRCIREKVGKKEKRTLYSYCLERSAHATSMFQKTPEAARLPSAAPRPSEEELIHLSEGT